MRQAQIDSSQALSLSSCHDRGRAAQAGGFSSHPGNQIMGNGWMTR